jgi:hypothetical protein
MNQALEQLSDAELRSFMSEHRNDEEAFSQALQVLMERKKYSFKYPPPQEMSTDEIEAIFRAKLRKNERES